MQSYLIINRHKDGTQDERQELRPAHVAWITSGGEGRVGVLTGAPTLDEDAAGEGNFFVVEARSREAAQGFVAGDPFMQAGLVAQSSVLLLRPPFDPDTIAQGLSPRLPAGG